MALWDLRPFSVVGQAEQDTTRDWILVLLDDHGRQAYFDVFTHIFTGVKECNIGAKASDYFPESTVCVKF
jgi:hypothetical protein